MNNNYEVDKMLDLMKVNSINLSVILASAGGDPRILVERDMKLSEFLIILARNNIRLNPCLVRNGL